MQFNWLLRFKRTKVSQRPEIPYVTGHAVGGSPAFIGRTDILKTIKDILSRSQQNAIVLSGQRRIGKTSVLKELEAKLPEQNYQPIFFDLMDKAHQSLEVILNDLAKTISQQLDEEEPQWKNTTYQFGKWLVELLESEKLSQKSLVLLFDEFDALNDTQAEQMRDEFFRYLRTLLSINPQRLNFIFAIGRNIDDFTAALSLFKDMKNYPVSLLTDKETDELIRLSENNQSLYWSKKAVQEIWELTHGHPLLTQLLCTYIWDQLWKQEPTSIPKVTSIKRIVTQEDISRVLNESQNGLEWLWDGLPPACKIVTAAFAELGKKNQTISQEEQKAYLYTSGIGTVIDELEMAPHSLKEWDMIEGDEHKGYRFRVELFRQWVVEHKPLTQIMQEELGRIRVGAEQYYQEGQSAAQHKQFDQAIDKLSTAIRINFHHIEAQKLLAKVFVEKGEIAQAQTALEKFHLSHPDMARSQLTEVLWIQVESCNRKEKQLRLCEQILEYDPTHSSAERKKKEIWQWQGRRFEEDEEYNKAREVYQKAGLKDKLRELRWKGFQAKYPGWIKFFKVFISVLFFSFLVSFFKSEITVSFNLPIPWWVWGLVFGVILGLFFVITEKFLFKKRTTKQEY